MKSNVFVVLGCILAAFLLHFGADLRLHKIMTA